MVDLIKLDKMSSAEKSRIVLTIANYARLLISPETGDTLQLLLAGNH